MLIHRFSIVGQSKDVIRRPSTIVLLCVAVALIPAFIVWMSRQERRGHPALIPNSVWKNRFFTSICSILFLVSIVLNAGEFFFSLL